MKVKICLIIIAILSASSCSLTQPPLGEVVSDAPAHITEVTVTEKSSDTTIEQVPVDCSTTATLHEPNYMAVDELSDLDYLLFVNTKYYYNENAGEMDYFGLLGNDTKTTFDGQRRYTEVLNEITGQDYPMIDNSFIPDHIFHMQLTTEYELITKFSPDMSRFITRKYIEHNPYYIPQYLYYKDGIAVDISDDNFTDNLEWESITPVVLRNMDDEREITLPTYLINRSSLSDDAALMAYEDTGNIIIFSLQDDVVLFTVTPDYFDAELPTFIHDFIGDKNSGKVIFTNGIRAYSFNYPANTIEVLGDYIFNPRLSPDGKFLAYATPSTQSISSYVRMTDRGDGVLDEYKAVAEYIETMPVGVYIVDLNENEAIFIEGFAEIISWVQQ